jgi:hypothetical protein
MTEEEIFNKLSEYLKYWLTLSYTGEEFTKNQEILDFVNSQNNDILTKWSNIIQQDLKILMFSDLKFTDLNWRVVDFIETYIIYRDGVVELKDIPT